jgi:peptidoglycan/LPS O-acetylase OafA/YrhL
VSPLVTGSDAQAVGPAGSPVPSRRREIEGLRTVAALLVAVYHIWLNKVSGGVDVFFVVTGYLITLTLVGQVVRSGRIRPLAYLGRLARRVWPLAALVLVAAIGITLTLAPQALRPRNFQEVLASALYVENWRLSASAVDYLDREDPHSVVQHYWAMSLQGQFYVIWLVVALVAFALARGRRPFTRTFGLLMVVVSVASFAWSVVDTLDQQPAAYFSTLTRLWEFGIGGLVALAGTRAALGGAQAAVASWVGLLGLVACGAVLPVAGIFPGYAALWPVVCAALLLVSTRRDELAWSATRLLSTRPLVWLGGVAFGIYLWHWPLLIAYRYVRGEQAVPSIVVGTALIVAAVALAVVSHRVVERPLGRGWTRGRMQRAGIGTALLAAWMAVVAIAGTATVDDRRRVEQVAAASKALEDVSGSCFGAGSLVVDACASDDPSLALVPDRRALLGDSGGAYGCYTPADAQTITRCTRGKGPVRVALVGNSHAAMYSRALTTIGRTRGWTLDIFVGNGCTWGAERPDDPDIAPICGGRLEEVESALLDRPYDLVIYAGGRGDAAPTSGDLAEIGSSWSELEDAGSQILVIEDNPRLDEDAAACVVESSEQDLRAGGCDVDRDVGLAAEDRYVTVAEGLDGTAVVETLDLLCREDTCPAATGNVIVYRDRHHLTATYIRSMLPELTHRIDAALVR